MTHTVYFAERILGFTVLFGKPYVWVVLDGRISLIPTTEAHPRRVRLLR